MTPSNDLLDDLEARGLVHDVTDRAALAERLGASAVTLYCGFDPTADSLHVGHLLGVVGLRRFADAGHLPLALVGGATGMIGDPSGRSTERNLLSPEQLRANKEGLASQIDRLMGSDARWEMVDNADWTVDVGLLDFLREVGKHVTVNQMLARESVRGRMETESGISFTEFSYQLLQAHDYWWLHEHRGCELQVGGSDQWGNITAGIDLIRRRGGSGTHGLTWPLLVRADGTKFGKSAGGATVWLDAARTSPYRFHQFWIQTPDSDVEMLLLRLTMLPVSEIAGVLAEHADAPHRRLAQHLLADSVTTFVHGAQAAAQAAAAADLLFGGSVRDAVDGALAMLVDEIPTWRVPSLEGGIAVVDALVASGLCTSKKEARRTIDQGGAYCNDARLDADAVITGADLLHGRYVLLRRGRKSYALLVSAGD